MSVHRVSPPVAVPGYEPEHFLGIGAYGEVWVARDKNTGRRVAIKFYAHRGGLDWSLLAREVEKLAFLFADRYVVQLLGVGWDADPPYYIMEYLERGSLAERIAAGPLPVDEAVALVREVATGLAHAHGKGVLHCDLKPANVLLDQDGRPRLADFGQSRLSSEQAPALGTLFYMAPEQADLEAVPDARWDVYALGALLYCALTGEPPHRAGKTVDEFERTPELAQRLARYRASIEQSPPPAGHRKRRGVDKMLAAIVDRCLAVDPAKRFPNIQSVLDALDARALRLARRPMIVTGAIGPALLLAVMALFAWHGFHAALGRSDEALTAEALKANGFAAQYVARTAAAQLEHRFRLVEQAAASERLRQTFAEILREPKFDNLLDRLSDPKLAEAEAEPLRRRFRELPDRQVLQGEFAAIVAAAMRPFPRAEVASWFFCDARGISVVRTPEGRTIGKNFAWRSYFHGGPSDLESAWRCPPDKHLAGTTLSDVFRSQATGRWTVAISTPVFDLSSPAKFLGVLVMTVEAGRFVELRGGGQQFAVLVDHRPGPHEGIILQHPMFDKLLAAAPAGPAPAGSAAKLKEEPATYRVATDDLPDTLSRQVYYRDPLAADPAGKQYDRRWLASMEPIRLRGRDTGWIVIVQEAYDAAIGATLRQLAGELIWAGLVALGLVALVMAGLWTMAKQMSRG